ncbi:transglutaminase domain-containing protein [Salinibacterium sp. dk2585]|uniref:transglutaminase family protein n=1 Tax=unclassified Salinibacterium TaxID=2632331 RepID=UPI0011C24BA2|nr:MULTISPECIES: transglutaminase domain-containing protein [unclassified Salinibacterium]QEE60943.1 transglutaminase domain-containing protein [Salinibacterium sp. dk2585]TXK56014.1 transglutaminase domain-containing protein [Salinibacterium sp. dk5596]
MTTQTPNDRKGLRMPSPRTWFDIAVLVVLMALGLMGFEPSFGSYNFLLPAIGGLVLGTATAIGTSLFRLGLIPTTLVALAAYFLVASPLTVPQQSILGVLPSLQSLGSVAVGSVYGWADILTLATPVGAPQYIAVVPYAATWIVSIVSVTLACRWLASRPRTPWRFAIALIGPLALYLASILIGTEQPFQAGARGAVFATLALIWLGWRREGSASVAAEGAARLRKRKLAGTAVVVGAAILLGGGAGFWIAPPNDQRFVLREEIEPPFDPLEYPSPLSGYRHYTKQVTDDVMFTVEGLQQGDRIRLATMDSFTGKLWNVTGPDTATDGSGAFQLVGRTLPQQRFVTPDKRRDVVFTMAGYDDVWMPSLGYADDLEFIGGDAVEERDNLRYNAATGTAVLTSGLGAGDSYRIDATVQQPLSAEELRDIGAASVELPPVLGVPDVVTTKAQEFAASATTPAQQLEAIRSALALQGFLSHGRASDTVPSRAGHGADRITELLERNQMVGDEEQYASAFALMARSFGYPARVVMGFAPEVTGDEGQIEVTGDDVSAWVEVAFDGIGWVSFDPTPEETDIPQDQTPKPRSEPQPQVRQPPRMDNDDEDLLSPVELEESDEEDDELPFELPGWVYVLAVSLLVPAMIVFVPMLIVALIKARRMRRRRSATAPHDRVAGAWDEMIDRFSELGFSVPRASTRLRIAEALERQAPTEQPLKLRQLAVATDAAVFSGVEVEPERSERTWNEAEAAVAAMRAGVSRMRRFLSRYRVRSARDWAKRMADGGTERR